MRELEPSEVDAITKTLEPVTSKKEIVALAAYGSQVAGYSTKDSDYDVILVARPFKQRIKYFYLKGETECSALVVDPKSFENDCRRSSLGEFVAGRMLNPYFPISGNSFLIENEIDFKKSVILEGLADAYAGYSEFASEICYPLKYFLFEKLRKRAAIYPPVVYSYSRTYSEPLMESNLPASLSAFRAAAVKLAKEGMIDYDEGSDSVKSPQRKFHEGVQAQIEALAKYTTKSLRQYAVHGYAGRVRPNVVGKEVIAKISRSRKSGKMPEAILDPKSSWYLPAGKLFLSSHHWLSDLASLIGLEENYKVKSKPLGEFYNSAQFFTLEDSLRKEKFAVKRYQDVKGIKWGVLNLWSLKNANFTVDPIERLFREYRGTVELPKFGLRTADVVAVFLDQKLLVTKFIQGHDLSELESEFFDGKSEDLSPFEKFGEELAVMHNSGYCMGDTKPSNVILANENSELYFADLEQVVPEGNKAWDVAEFVFYSVRFTLKEVEARKLVNAFIDAYRSKADEKQIIRECETFRYRAPFQPFIAPNVMNAVRKDLVAG